MTVFNYLLIGHLVGDFLFQTNWMAINKSTKWVPLLSHCTVYTASLFSLALVGNYVLPIEVIVLLFVSHIVLDRRKFVVWWVERIMNSKGPESKWLKIVVDQVFHILILAIVAHFWF
ncbi:DUF3307 domain-containing protein [Sporosarcina sp. CAU 1771]